ILAWPAPVLLARARWPMHAPAPALLLWQAIGLAGGGSMIGARALLGRAVAPDNPPPAAVPARLLPCYLIAPRRATAVTIPRQPPPRHPGGSVGAFHTPWRGSGHGARPGPAAPSRSGRARGRDRPRTRARGAAPRHPALGVPCLAFRAAGPAPRGPRGDGGRRD